MSSMMRRPSPPSRKGRSPTPSPPSSPSAPPSPEDIQLAHAKQIEDLKAAHAAELEERARDIDDVKDALKRAKEDLEEEKAQWYDDFVLKDQELEDLRKKYESQQAKLTDVPHREAYIKDVEKALEESQETETKAIKRADALQARCDEQARLIRKLEAEASEDFELSEQAHMRGAKEIRDLKAQLARAKSDVKIALEIVDEVQGQLEAQVPPEEILADLARLRGKLESSAEDQVAETKYTSAVEIRCGKLERAVHTLKEERIQRTVVMAELYHEKLSLEKLRRGSENPPVMSIPPVVRWTRPFWVAAGFGFLLGVILGGLVCVVGLRAYFLEFGQECWGSPGTISKVGRNGLHWFWYYTIGYRPDWAAKLAWDLAEWQEGNRWWPIFTDDYTAPYQLIEILKS
ncbi:MAG: hypothetical protein M1823_005279 [Watsoniomyces obsoletus]|nr:MAG: hypothetical protein M1823_005279 [Watsoniomyces obsoletus]